MDNLQVFPLSPSKLYVQLGQQFAQANDPLPRHKFKCMGYFADEYIRLVKWGYQH